MTLRQYILIMVLGTLLCWVSWGFVLLNVDPFRDAGLGMLFFFISLFFALLGTSSLIGFGMLQLLSRRFVPMYHHVKRSFTIGVSISAFLVVLLFLQGKQILSPANAGILVGIIVFIALFKFSLRFSNA